MLHARGLGRSSSLADGTNGAVMEAQAAILAAKIAQSVARFQRQQPLESGPKNNFLQDAFCYLRHSGADLPCNHGNGSIGSIEKHFSLRRSSNSLWDSQQEFSQITENRNEWERIGVDQGNLRIFARYQLAAAQRQDGPLPLGKRPGPPIHSDYYTKMLKDDSSESRSPSTTSRSFMKRSSKPGKPGFLKRMKNFVSNFVSKLNPFSHSPRNARAKPRAFQWE